MSISCSQSLLWTEDVIASESEICHPQAQEFGPEPRIFWHKPADELRGLCATCREVVTKVTHLIAERNIVQHPTLEVNSQRDANSPFLQPENATGPGKTRSEVEVAPQLHLKA